MDRKRGLKTLLNIDVGIASAALLVLIACTFCGVIMRYIVGKPLGWIEEVQMLCIVWVVFAAGGAAFRTGSHVAIEVVVEMFPKSIQKLIEVFIGIVVTLTLVLLLTTCFDYMQLFVKTGRSTSILKIPFLYIYMIVPISSVLQIFNYFLVYVFGYKEEEQKIEEVGEE